MMILRKKIVEKEQDAAHSSSVRLGTNGEGMMVFKDVD